MFTVLKPAASTTLCTCAARSCIRHAAGDHDGTVGLAQTNVVLRKQRADLRIDQRKIGADVNVKHQKLTAALLPGDEVDLTESFSVNQHLIGCDQHGFRDFRIRNRKASDRAIEIDHARLSHQNVDGDRFFVLAERRLVGVFLGVRDGSSKDGDQDASNKLTRREIGERLCMILCSFVSSDRQCDQLQIIQLRLSDLRKIDAALLGAFDHFH